MVRGEIERSKKKKTSGIPPPVYREHHPQRKTSTEQAWPIFFSTKTLDPNARSVFLPVFHCFKRTCKTPPQHPLSLTKTNTRTLSNRHLVVPKLRPRGGRDHRVRLAKPFSERVGQGVADRLDYRVSRAGDGRCEQRKNTRESVVVRARGGLEGKGKDSLACVEKRQSTAGAQVPRCVPSISESLMPTPF